MANYPKYVYVMYVKSKEYEGVFAFLTEEEAHANAKQWGKYASVHQVQIEG